MPAPIEIHAYLGLGALFRERHWSNPRTIETEEEITGRELLERLKIGADTVEVLFLNRKCIPLEKAVIRPGDRVALIPPGVPGPHRFLLGFKNT
jgi:sulfur carrier protein ThiS